MSWEKRQDVTYCRKSDCRGTVGAEKIFQLFQDSISLCSVRIANFFFVKSLKYELSLKNRSFSIVFNFANVKINYGKKI